MEKSAVLTRSAREGSIALEPLEKVRILGVDIHVLDMAQAVERIASMVEAGGPFQVVTPNVDHIMRVRKNAAFREVYENADLVVADGAPVVWASRFLGKPLPERVAGSDLTPLLCEMAAKKGYSVYLMGGKPGAAEKSAEILEQRYKGLKVAGYSCPPFGFEKDPETNARIIEEIKKAGPHLLFVAVGSPKQDIWIYKHKEELGVPVSMGVGATLDFIAGIVKRAPRFMQRMGLEWLWRFFSEPGRLWKRYFIDDMPFFFLVLKQKVRG